MPSLVVRNLDESIINALKARAVEHQRSTEPNIALFWRKY